ncbi:FG-GAP repeat domain-containing protein [Streptomyces sp. NPDC048111]|uniref:FG-GAP repeat domain-containing protein n=1 Tax=Streptomyces sp. NPDC048111 TaxID=3365500 RepID=UPI003722A61A
MRSTHMSKRARRTAACTAIALAAVGSLLSTPALADTKGSATPKAAAADKAAPRYDWDKDGLGDIVRNGSIGYPSSFLLQGLAQQDDKTYPLLVDADLVGAHQLVTPGDLNGNGKPEIITVTSDGTLKLFADVNDGPYRAIWASSGWNAYDRIVAAGDLSGDGKNDLLARGHRGELYLFPGTGDVTAPFGARIDLPGLDWSDFDQIVGVSDADGDGVGDVFARNRTDDLIFFAGTGNPEKPFKPGVELGAGWHAYNQLLSADDRTGDGLSDLLARDLAGNLYLYRSIGGGHFADPVPYRSGWNRADMIAGVGGVAAIDQRFLVGRDAEGRTSSRYVTNNGQFSAPTSSDTPQKDRIGNANSLDGTGVAATLTLTAGHLVVDSFSAHADLGAGWDGYTSITGPGDLTGDGHGDLLARDKAGTMWIYPGDGGGKEFGSRIKAAEGWNTYNRVLGSGDVNGDGRADVLARGTDGHLSLFPGTGDANAPFAARQDLGGGWNGYTMLTTVSDASGNGTTDLIAVDPSGQGYRYDGQGAYGGKFQPRASLGGGWNMYKELL